MDKIHNSDLVFISVRPNFRLLELKIQNKKISFYQF